MPLIAGAMVAGPIVGGLVGNVMSQKDRSAQKKAMKQALAELESVGLPPDLSKEIIFQQFQQVGVLTPQLEEDLSDTFAESEMAKVKPNEALSKEQMASIGGLKLLSKTGLGAEDRAALNEMRSRLRQDEQASTQALLQKLQAQGMGGSGAAIMAAIGNSQQAANLASREADALSANQSSARRQALTELGRAAGEMQQQQFNREAMIAQAMDERNRFLQENSISRQQRNVGTLNAAQLQNLQEKQRIAEANINQANQEKLRQVQEQGALYDRTLGYKQAKANALTGQAGYYGQQAANTAQSFGQMGAGIGTAAGALGSAKGGTLDPKTGQVTGGSALGNWMKFGSAEDGGIVGDPETAGGATIGPDNVNMNLREGEMVLNAEQQGALFDFLKRIGNKFPKD